MTSTQLTLTIAGVTLAWLTLVVSIIGAAWLNQRALERQIDGLKETLRAEMKEMRAEIKTELRELRFIPTKP